MGFRSTLMVEHTYLTLPQWFIDKYKEQLFIDESGKVCTPPIASKWERKFYSDFKDEELFTDLQKVINEQEDYDHMLSVVLLHECGGITMVEVTRDSIRGKEPTGWKETTGVNHSYCYGCSELPHPLVRDANEVGEKKFLTNPNAPKSE